MKKIAFFSVVLFLLVAPAWATVTITTTVQQVSIKDPNNNPITVDTDTAIIGWSSSDANRVRAFALDITLDRDPNDVNSNPKIDSVTVLDANYWVFPGSIDINTNVEPPVVDNYGTPVGDPCSYPGTKPGLDSNGVTVELGSLYEVGAKTPGTSGNLLKITVTDNCVIKVAPNEIRGGVVMEDASSGTNWPAGRALNFYTRPDKAEWRAVGRPKCWARGIDPRQCHGDADAQKQGKSNYWTSTFDAEVFNAAKNQTLAQIQGQTVKVGAGTPQEKVVKLICADFDHKAQGKNLYRVSTDDAFIFNTWKNRTNLPDCNCP